MKNLANCKPSEFLMQTNKIRKSVENWLSLTKVLEIRKHLPEFKEGQSAAERRALLTAQSQKNLSALLDAAMGEHPKETLELLALLCFVEPENVDDHPMSEYIGAINELISDEAVIGFFTSLVKLGQTNI